MLTAVIIILALHVCDGSLAGSDPLPLMVVQPGTGLTKPGSDSRCPPTGAFGICAFTCTSNSCRAGRICCPTACGGSQCKKPYSPPAPQPPAPQPLPKPCPPGVPMVMCTTIPCGTAMCPNHPQATCVNNYCGGCKANFDQNGRDVTNTCKKTSPTVCSDGQLPVNCFVNPLLGSSV